MDKRNNMIYKTVCTHKKPKDNVTNFTFLYLHSCPDSIYHICFSTVPRLLRHNLFHQILIWPIIINYNNDFFAILFLYNRDTCQCHQLAL